ENYYLSLHDALPILITSLAGFIVGIAMFGAIIFLPQYLQIVKGESPTASGLLTLPLVAGLLAGTIGSGRMISRTGRYKRYPVVGDRKSTRLNSSHVK